MFNQSITNLLIVILCAFSVNSFAATFIVPTTQCPTIQMAIDQAQNGDTVTILPGYYSGPGNYDLDLRGKALIIQSTLPTDSTVVASTIIDCTDDKAHLGFRFQSYPYSTTIVDGLTIWGGNMSGNGGIIYCSGSGPTIRNCVFKFGGATSGGILYCDNHSSLTLVNCIFSYGSAMNGGAIYSMSSKVTAQNCEFVNNTCSMDGAGLYLQDTVAILTDCNFSNNMSSDREGHSGALYTDAKSQLTLKCCDFVGNYSYYSGSAILTAANINLTNCEIVSNTSMSGPAIISGNGSIFKNCLIAGNYNPSGKYGIVSAYYPPSSLKFFNCTFTQNRGDQSTQIGPDYGSILYNSIVWPCSYTSQISCSYSDYGTSSQSGIGNISQDPLFVDAGSWQGTVFIAGDYHLRPESPCINAGNPNYILEQGETDLDGQSRIKLDRIDMGAFEGNTHPMDLDQNGIVDFRDFSKVAEAWLWKAKWNTSK